jgi:hypothetical protein
MFVTSLTIEASFSVPTTKVFSTPSEQQRETLEDGAIDIVILDCSTLRSILRN